MKEFIQILRRFVPPYKKYLALSTLFNILSAVLNIFSFSLIVPILSILFQMEKATYTFMPWSSDASIKDIVINNGAEMLVAIAGEILRMPGLPKVPQAEHIDIVDGNIEGLS